MLLSTALFCRIKNVISSAALLIVFSQWKNSHSGKCWDSTLSDGFQRYHTRQEISFEIRGEGCGERNTFYGTGQGAKEGQFIGTWQVQISLVNRSHLTTHQPTIMWEHDEKKTLKTLVTLPNSCLHLSVLFFYILIELILHFIDSVSYFMSSAQF